MASVHMHNQLIVSAEIDIMQVILERNKSLNPSVILAEVAVLSEDKKAQIKEAIRLGQALITQQKIAPFM